MFVWSAWYDSLQNTNISNEEAGLLLNEWNADGQKCFAGPCEGQRRIELFVGSYMKSYFMAEYLEFC